MTKKGSKAKAAATDLQDLPGVDTPPEGAEQAQAETSTAATSPAEPVKVPAGELSEITITIPIDLTAIDRAGYISRRHDLRVSRPQAEAIRCVTDALETLEETTADGKQIQRRDRCAIAWILDRLTAAVAEARKETE